MVNPDLAIFWDSNARNALKCITAYIRQESEQNVQKVKNEIISVIQDLPAMPARFPPDKYKTDNDGSYPAFVKHKYRVAYRITANQIRILRIRSEKQEPLYY